MTPAEQSYRRLLKWWAKMRAQGLSEEQILELLAKYRGKGKP
jgi:hypothetical protein